MAIASPSFRQASKPAFVSLAGGTTGFLYSKLQNALSG
jgi:hypothetical protein